MPCSYIGGKVPKLIVRDVFRNVSRYYCAKKNINIGGIRSIILLRGRQVPLPLDYRNIFFIEQEGQNFVSRQYSHKSRNLSSYIMECGSTEKFELFGKVSTNFTENIFPKYLL
jgi:hypothetical protein